MLKKQAMLAHYESRNADDGGSEGPKISHYYATGLCTANMNEPSTPVRSAIFFVRTQNKPTPSHGPTFYTNLKMLFKKAENFVCQSL